MKKTNKENEGTHKKQRKKMGIYEDRIKKRGKKRM
jgi:hypothetical protein